MWMMLIRLALGMRLAPRHLSEQGSRLKAGSTSSTGSGPVDGGLNDTVRPRRTRYIQQNIRA